MLSDGKYLALVDNTQRVIEDVFEIKEMLGSGSFSSVYRALDKSHRNKECAIKILN